MPTYTPSDALIDLLRFGSTLVLARLTVYSDGASTVYTLPVSEAQIAVTRNSAQRRQCTITMQVVPTVPPPAILPTNPTSVLAPFGNEVFIQLGIAPAGNVTTVTWAPMGLFSIVTSTVDDTTNDLAITIQGYDRSFVIGQRKFKTPYNVPAATGNFVQEIQHLLNQVWGSNPPLVFNITPTTATVPTASFNQGSTPWTAAIQMANAVGYELFFNVDGVVTGYPIPTPAKQPVTWNFTDTPGLVYGDTGTSGGSTVLLGSPYSTPTETSVQMTRNGIFNDVLVTGSGSYNTTGSSSGSTSPVLGEAATENPASATNINGGLGDLPDFVATNLILTATQAEDAAENYLQAALLDAWQVTITSSPIPFLDVDDVVTITRARIGLQTVKVVIDSITYKVSYSDLCSITGRVVP